jgi:hypothetical protein
MFHMRGTHPLNPVRLNQLTDAAQPRQHIVRERIQLRGHDRIQRLNGPHKTYIAKKLWLSSFRTQTKANPRHDP